MLPTPRRREKPCRFPYGGGPRAPIAATVVTSQQRASRCMPTPKGKANYTIHIQQPVYIQVTGNRLVY